ncbi:MAG: NAD-dependent epimerase/dehydratase family protein [Phycisphaerae bacterium]
MRIALTGATGFLGRYVVARLIENDHVCRCWYRPSSDRSGFAADDTRLEWVLGELGSAQASATLVEGCDAVVHAALHRPGAGFRGAEGDLTVFVEKNVLGTIRLTEAARAAAVKRFVFISTCAVHERILGDRPLDEAHPLWATSHYGAHKAAIEKFVHSYGLGHGYEICALRPTGIYGVAHPVENSRWYNLVRRVAGGKVVRVAGGGKEVHAADVARAVEILLSAPAEQLVGQAFNCYDMYVSEYDVAMLARELSGSRARIIGEQKHPKHQIETGKLRALGMEFGGRALLDDTVRQLLARS